LPADGRRTVFIFALLLETVSLLIGGWSRGTPHERSLATFSNVLFLGSLLLAAFPFIYGTEALSLRFGFLLRAFGFWTAYTVFLAILGVILFGRD